ncbi:hypothetical protein ACFTZI_02425 [Streptomyces decoyicus]|uniref:hypothetical protein n=1 Tax=Streptomyces decoyicus TaxID=249567 RepID=UPI00362763F8
MALLRSDSGRCPDVNRGQQSGWGNYLNIWDCHDIDGVPSYWTTCVPLVSLLG